MKIKNKHAGLISTVLISISMSLSISFFMTIINKTPMENFLVSWLSSSFVGTMIGIPLASIYVPNILRAVENMKDEDCEGNGNEKEKS